MKDQVLLSIIVPVYNTQDYLNDCLTSLLDQDIKNYEIICINDGSTDGSLSVLEDFANKSDKFKIMSQKNMGQSIARNRGISISKGKYLYFMDSDDLIEPNSLSYILEKMESKLLDMYLFDAESFINQPGESTNGVINYDRGRSYGFYEKGVSLFNDLVKDRKFSASPCLYVSRKEFIIANNIQFIEDIIHEDEAFTAELLLNAGRVMHENKLFFKRRIRSGSTMTKQRTEKNFNGYYSVFKKLHSYLDDQPARIRLATLYNSLNKIYQDLSEADQKKVRSLYDEARQLAEENNYYTPVNWLQNKNSFTNYVFKQLVKLKQNLKKGEKS